MYYIHVYKAKKKVCMEDFVSGAEDIINGMNMYSV